MTDTLPPVDPPAYPTAPPVPVTVAPKRSRSFLIALTGGGGLVVVGTFMPWVSVTSVFGTITKNGIDTPDGVFILILGAALIGTGLKANTHHVPKGLRIMGIIIGAVTGLLAIAEATNISTRLAAITSNPYATAAVGGGVYVLVAGAVLGFFGALAAGWDKPGDGR